MSSRCQGRRLNCYAICYLRGFCKTSGITSLPFAALGTGKSGGALLWVMMSRKRRGSELPRSLFTMEIRGEPFGLSAVITSSGYLAR